MHIVYKITHLAGEGYYIGSKINYVEGKYSGSSRHPLFVPGKLEILEIVSDPKEVTTRERIWQERFDILNDPACYNMVYAGTKFNTIGFRWVHDPVTLQRALMPEHMKPTGWEFGTKPKHLCYTKLKTPYKVGDPRLSAIRSESNKKAAKRGLEHAATKKWQVVDPEGTIHLVAGLHSFCEQRNLSVTALQYSYTSKKPIKKGLSKGWYILDKC